MYKLSRKGSVQRYFDEYNRVNKTNYVISDLIFPKKNPYGWKNYPYDYYNIWVKNAGRESYMEEPTLEMLTSEYDIIIFKHCFPVGRIMEDLAPADINSQEKRLGNYKLQYDALKRKMHSFPATKFIVWTPPALVKSQVTEEEATRTQKFHKWLTEEWKEKGDNIYLWDFYAYETEGSLYLKEEYAYSVLDSHPSKSFSERMAQQFSRFIIDVIQTDHPLKNKILEDGHHEPVSAHSAGNLEAIE
jgi:hypothetical protein